MSFFETNEKKDCNGCGVCALKCPKNAIEMLEDDEGFLYPQIDKMKCNNCGLCKKICPNHDYEINDIVETYIAINNNEDELKNSSSGGMFYILAKSIISNNGVVFGVKYNEELKVVHDYAITLEECIQFQGSKYVKSDLSNSFEKVREFLKQEKQVLFTGTPCQCQGLRTYLGEYYDKLITCDILCHANPSPKIFELYKNNIEKRYNSKIISINFRNKRKYGWHSGNHTDVRFENGKEKDIPSFTNAFQVELINRPSCHNCHFCSINRLSDFTIGDIWGIEKIDNSVVESDKGVSILCVNSEKGRSVFDSIKNDIFCKKIDKNIAIKYNHNSNVMPHRNRELFFKGVAEGKINSSNVIKYMKKYSNNTIYGKIKRKCKKIVKRVFMNV